MNMPVQNRKYFISRHNRDTEESNNQRHGKSITTTGEATENYSKISIADHQYLNPN